MVAILKSLIAFLINEPGNPYFLYTTGISISHTHAQWSPQPMKMQCGITSDALAH